ncbi:MAG: DUF2156 domain-containing protein [Clostridia bacterium]|nr:DUF2156 domain-containing protein [Clostridia bacterium]
MLQPLSFAPLSLSQKQQVEAIRTASANTLYVYTFTSLFAWQEDEQYEICLLDDAFLVKNGAEGEHAYLFPCGSESGKKQLIDALLAYSHPVFYTLTEDDKLFLEREYPGQFVFEECRSEFPYLYDRQEQTLLSGKRYKRLRHRINQGRAVARHWDIQPLSEENIARALRLNQRWAEQQSGDALADTRAAQEALNHFSDLSVWGLLFEADGEDIAYVAGCFVSEEIFDISFCKVLDNRCDCFVKWSLYSALPPAVKIVDSEEDLGLEGLRKHKMLRIPKELTRVWKGSYIHE